MTANQSTARLFLYVAAAVLTVLASDFDKMAGATQHEWIGLFLKAALAGVVAGRAYIDKSPTEVLPPKQ
jgi:hypothetical protein